MDENFEHLVEKAFASRNEHQFRHIFYDLKENPNEELKAFQGFSTFEKVLTTRNSKRFIEICLRAGSDFHRKNSKGIFPIQYAIESLCAENLETLITIAKASPALMNYGEYRTIFYSMMINTTLKDGNNFLNFLIEKLNKENYDDVSEMIKILLLNGCNPNQPNGNSETFFYLLLLKLQNQTDKTNLITFCLEKAKIDFHSYKRQEIISLMDARGLSHKVTLKGEPKADVNFMMQQLDNNDEAAFIKNFTNFKLISGNFYDDIARLMEEAIARGLVKAVELLMQHCADINAVYLNGRFQLSPAELACTFGHHNVLEVLLRASDLLLKQKKAKSTLLHVVLLSELADEDDRRKCFEIIITDHRCTLEIINSADEDDQTPLSVACVNGFDDVARELLRRGAYIGQKSIVDNIGKDLLKDFLDKSIKCSSYPTDKNCEVHVDYRFLMPPNVRKKRHQEMQSVNLIAENDKLRDLILHPVFSTFLALKWRMISYIVYFNLLVYFSFLVFYGVFVVSNLRYEENKNITYKNYSYIVYEREDGSIEQDYDNWLEPFSYDFFMYYWNYWVCVIGIIIIAVNELIQCIVSFRKYFTKASNYLDLFFVFISSITLLMYLFGDTDTKEIRSMTILMVAAQCIQIITRVSIFSISLHMTIFKRVCSTFLKTMSLYMILIIAFAMSFHTLHDKTAEDPLTYDYNENDSLVVVKKNISFYNTTETDELDFSDIFSAVILTVRMMVSDFDGIRLVRDDHFQGVLFLLFVILISIVLFNLLNALTISDTYNILRDAELVETKKTVSILKSYEKMFSVLRMSCGNIFPRLSSIILKPNSSDLVVTCEQRDEHGNVAIQIKSKKCCWQSNDLKAAKKAKKPHIKFSAKLMQKVREYITTKHEKDDVDAKLEKFLKIFRRFD